MHRIYTCTYMLLFAAFLYAHNILPLSPSLSPLASPTQATRGATQTTQSTLSHLPAPPKLHPHSPAPLQSRATNRSRASLTDPSALRYFHRRAHKPAPSRKSSSGEHMHHRLLPLPLLLDTMAPLASLSRREDRTLAKAPGVRGSRGERRVSHGEVSRGRSASPRSRGSRRGRPSRDATPPHPPDQP